MTESLPTWRIITACWLTATLAVSPAVHAKTIDSVISISVDGLHAGHLRDLIENDSPTAPKYANLTRFINEGATTYNARTDYFLTNTLPNHATMMTGRPVLQPTGQPNTVHHGYTFNGNPQPSDTLHNQGNPNLPYVASVFDVVHDHGLSTALYPEKPKFDIFDQTWNAANGAPDVTGSDNGQDKIGGYFNPATQTVHTKFVIDMNFYQFNYSFVHFFRSDNAGHGFGWGSPEWNDSVAVVDTQVGAILDLVDNSATLQNRTVVILTTDHGGVGTGHGDVTDANNYTVPFFVMGAGVPAGADLYALNPLTRLDPGTGRPDYNAAVQPIRNGDAANLALSLLGLGPVPGSTINGGQTLVVPLPASGTCAGLVLACAFIIMARRRRE